MRWVIVAHRRDALSGVTLAHPSMCSPGIRAAAVCGLGQVLYSRHLADRYMVPRRVTHARCCWHTQRAYSCFLQHPHGVGAVTNEGVYAVPRRKALLALSCLARNHGPALDAFRAEGGLRSLIASARDGADPRQQRCARPLIHLAGIWHGVMAALLMSE